MVNMQASTKRHNPYVGPRAFEYGERLYGRDREVLDLLDLLIAERIVMLYSPSGAGKSSLVQAGLMPELEEEGFEVLPVIRVNQELPPATDGNRYLYSTLLSLEEGRDKAERLAEADLRQLSLSDYLIQHEATVEDLEGTVLIFDQFEEILTLEPTNQTAKQAFFAGVGEALRQPHRWALFSLREDYIAGLDPYLRLVPTRLNTTFRLELLGRHSARQAMQGPANEKGVTFTDEAADKLVADLSLVRVQQRDGTIEEKEGLYVEPVQLQVVCRRLWDGKFPPDTPLPEEGTIEAEDVESVGDVDSALAGYYAERIKAIAAETGLSQRAIRDWCGEALITETGIRGQVLSGPNQGLEDRVVLALMDAHLVRGEERRGAIWYELAHDRLIKPVQDDNATWRETHLHHLQRQAALWHKAQRPDGLLLKGEDLAEAEAWAKTVELLDFEADFLKAGQKAREVAEREARQAERIRILAAEAQSRQLASQAANLLESAYDLALLLAIEAARKAGTVEADTVLRRAFVYPGSIQTLAGHVRQGDEPPVTQILWSRDETHILTAGKDHKVRLWEVATGRELMILSMDSGVKQASWNRDETLIAAVSDKGVARIWNSIDGTVLSSLGSNTSSSPSFFQTGDLEILEAVWDREGSHLLTKHSDGSVWEWEAQTKRWYPLPSPPQFAPSPPPERPSLANIASAIPPVWNDAGTLALTADEAGKVYVRNGQVRSGLPTLPGDVAAWSPDGTRILSLEGTGMRLWDAETGRELTGFSGHTDEIWQAGWNKAGTRILTSSADGTARLWDAETGQALLVLAGHTRLVNRASWNDDETQILTASDDGTARLWDGASGAELAVLAGHQGRVNLAIASPDGRRVLTSSADGTARIWDANSGLEQVVLAEHSGEVIRAAWNAAGNRILTAGADGTARVWDAVDGELLLTLTGHRGRVWQAIWNQEETRILTAGSDGTARLWDAYTGKEIISLVGHTDEIRQAVWNREETRILTASADGTARLWHAQTGTDLTVLSESTTRLWSAAWNRDESRLLTTGADGVIRQYHGSLAELLEAAFRRAARNMSLSEWRRYLGDEPYRKTSPHLPLHLSFVEAGRDLARAGDMAGAIQQFQAALELEPALDLDPETEAAKTLVVYARELARADDIQLAMDKLRQALALKPTQAEAHYRLCMFGVFAGATGEVMPSCEEAVRLAGEDERAAYRQMRGIARALTDDYPGASEDLEAYSDWLQKHKPDSPELSRQQVWLMALGQDANPFAEITALETLRHELEPTQSVRFTRTARVGIHGRHGLDFHEADYRLIRTAGIETIKVLSMLDPITFARLKRENPDIEFIVRLYDDRIGPNSRPTPAQFAEHVLPIMAHLQPYVTKFEIHNEPNHPARYEGWGDRDEDARNFTAWFLEVFDRLKTAHPWAELGFPGLAVPQRDLEWIETARPAVEQADWLGVHIWWRTVAGQESNHLNDFWGLRFKYYHQKFPGKPIEITEFGNANIQSGLPITEAAVAREYVEFYRELFKYPYVRSVCAFIMSSADPTWEGFTWRSEDGRFKEIVTKVEQMPRPSLKRQLDFAAALAAPPLPETIAPPPSTTEADVLPPTVTLPLINIQNIVDQLARHASLTYPQRSLQDIRRIIVHHTATPPTVTVQRIAQFQVNNRNLPGITYHFCLTAEGVVYQTQPLDVAAAHAGPHSSDSVGLCLIGNFTNEAPPEAQLKAAAGLLAQLVTDLNLALDQIFGYSELVVTQSPGATWPVWKELLLTQVRSLISGDAGEAAEMSPFPVQPRDIPPPVTTYDVEKEAKSLKPGPPPPPPSVTPPPPPALESVMVRPASAPSGENPYIYGLFDRGGEHLLLADGQAKGWLVLVEAIGANPDEQEGRDYSDLAGQGLGVIVVLVHGFGPEGTLPPEDKYADFAKRAANFVQNSAGSHIWVIGNEMNMQRAWPRIPGSDEGQPLTPDRYAGCFRQVRQAIRSVSGHENDQVVVGAVGVWNAELSYEADPQGRYPANKIPGAPNMYPYSGFFGDWIIYLRDILLAIGPNNVDGLAIHTYSHGYEPALIFDQTKMGPPFQNYYYHFYAYINQMEVIPQAFRDLPVYLTEMNGDVAPDRSAWPDVNNGWIKNAYTEINNWNKTPNNQKIRAAVLYRWAAGDMWSIARKPAVQQDFQEALARNYRWAAEETGSAYTITIDKVELNIEFIASPNFNRRRAAGDISAIVMHATANSSQEAVIKWFGNPNAQVSAHYSIGKEGRIVQHVRDENRAWHAGRSIWKGRPGVNDYAIGIELINLNDGRDPYPEAQHRAAVYLVAYLVDKYNIRLNDITTHAEVGLPPGRKSDPRGYDLERLRREVAALLEAK